MNDLLQLSNSPCPCGSPYTAIRAIHGRADDIFHLPHRLGSGTVRIFPDYIRRSIVMASPDIRRYRAILEHDGTLHIELDTTPGKEALAAQEVSRGLNELFTRYSALPPALRFHPCTSTAGINKLKRVECRWHNG